MDNSESDSPSEGSDNEGDMFMDEDKDKQDESVSNKRAIDDEEQLPAKKKKKPNKENELRKLQKPPTVEELNRLRETENLFHSNLFRRQIEEMLKELEIKNKTKVRVNVWFEQLKEWIAKMEDSGENRKLTEFEWLGKVQLPLAMQHATKGSYRFRKPLNAKIVGSYLTKTFLLKNGSIDVNVTMPSQFFDKEDYLNGRYFTKKALYLCEIANHLKCKKDLVQDVKFSSASGDDWRPFLEVTPAGKLHGKVSFLIKLVPEEPSFRLNRFLPTRNNVRSRWFLGEQSNLKDEDCPTPEYNSGILADLRSDANATHLAGVIGSSPQLRDAVILLKVWARQRDLHIGHGAFTGEILTFIVAYLLHIRKISVSMSSYQVIRTVWNYLSTANWSDAGITLCSSTSEQQPPITDFHQNFPIVFVDPSGFLNLTSGMCQTLFRRCKDEAMLAVKYLDTPDVNCFQILFMAPAPFSRLCDQTILFHNWTALENACHDEILPAKKLDNPGVNSNKVRTLIVALLSKALGNRVDRIFVGPTARQSWHIHKKPKSPPPLTVGLLLDPKYCFNLVDRGPAANSEEAVEFREFWKSRCEIRRFKDGSITESVLWSGKTWSQRRMICRQISQFILSEKLGLSSSDFQYHGDDLEAVLPSYREEKTSDILEAYEKLHKDLRDLDDLPLEVLSTQGSSSVFRSTDVFPPKIPHLPSNKVTNQVGNCALVDPNSYLALPWCAPAEIVIQLGSSNKWPRDLGAVRRLRAAFNVKIAQLLTEKYTTHAFLDYVDVLTPACVFRLRIVYPGEIGLMKMSKTPDGVVMYRDTPESLQLELIAEQRPHVTSALSGLQSMFNSFGTACCLAKRWVRSRLLHATHIADEVIDLLVASVYVNSDPWRPPNQPQLAFLRFLALLAHTDWNMECIILNFNGVLSRDETRKIESHFESNRVSLPPMVLATPDDQERSLWTRNGPSGVVLHRLTALALNALNLLETQLNAPQQELGVLEIFKPSSLGVFDVVINLVKGFLPRIGEKFDSKSSADVKSSVVASSVIPVTGFDPAECYVRELEKSYGDWALFFYDPHGGSSVGVLWKPTSKSPVDYKVANLHGRTLDKETKKLKLNVSAVLEGFHVLGAGLVKTVEVRNGDTFVPVRF